jgi:hypothetical protein
VFDWVGGQEIKFGRKEYQSIARQRKSAAIPA